MVDAARNGGAKCATFAPRSPLIVCEFYLQTLYLYSVSLPTIESQEFLLIGREKVRHLDMMGLEDNIAICTRCSFRLRCSSDIVRHLSQNNFYRAYDNSPSTLFPSFFRAFTGPNCSTITIPFFCTVPCARFSAVSDSLFGAFSSRPPFFSTTSSSQLTRQSSSVQCHRIPLTQGKTFESSFLSTY